jgi:GTP-binding protein HflX
MTKNSTPTAREKEKVFLVGLEMEEMTPHELEVQMRELEELTENLYYEIVGQSHTRLREINRRLFVGSGKALEITEEAKKLGARTIIFNEELSPSQQRNWETESALRVIDRQEIILEIFEQRAQTKEAVLQVQLARMEYMLPRLKRAWTHLERQRGGGTGARGVGEKQLELDGRMVRDKIAQLKQELADVRTQRGTQRKSRERVPLTSAAIVGYTNAGKSTLLNRLTGSEVLSVDKLFATLDPTTRRLALPSGQKILLTDTVGFIRKLPHNLIEAFKATLEETILADFLLHVVDVSDPEMEAQRRTTLEVLQEIGASGKPIITVFNKADRLEKTGVERMTPPMCCYLSATTGEGVEDLLVQIDELMQPRTRPVKLLIPHSRYDLVNLLHEAGGVTRQKHEAKGISIEGRLTQKIYERVKDFEK